MSRDLADVVVQIILASTLVTSQRDSGQQIYLASLLFSANFMAAEIFGPWRM